jgi:hypothetical protein
MAEEGFSRACLPAVGGVELLSWQVSLPAALKWLKVSQRISCLLYVCRDFIFGKFFPC